MNGVIYYLLTSFTAKKNKAKSTKQTLSRLSQTGHQFVCQQVQRSQHFLNFSSKHHFYQLSCKRLQNFGEIFAKNQHQKKQQQVHRDEGKNGRRNTTTTTTKKHECNNNSLCCFSFFLISFVYKRECLPNRTRGMTTMIFVFRTHFFKRNWISFSHPLTLI